MIRPKPMFWILLFSIILWYFIILYPITTILSIIGTSIIGGLILRNDERFKNE
jgi:hypothetical protein